MLKISGQWVSPAEVEGLLFEHPAVLEAAVVGWEDDNRLLKPKAFVVLKDGYGPSPELAAELQKFVKERTLPHKYPRWVEFVSDLPKTATGKIQRYKLRVSSQ
jgi:benzoate-CoA ligase